MILPLWRSRPDNFVEFRHQEERIVALEKALFKQRAVNEDLLTYIEADMATTWMTAANTLVEALREALKEE